MIDRAIGLALPRRWLAAAAVVGVTVGYSLAVDPVVRSPAQVVYPVAWLAISAVALWWTVRPRWDSLDAVSVLVGAGYTVLLLAVAGLLGPAATGPGLSIHLGFPGWGPALVLSGPFLRITMVPFLTAGYVTLGLLAAVTVQRTRTGAAPGIFGLFACVSCTAPLLAGIAGSVGAGSLAAALTEAQYPLATAAFLLAVGGFVAVLRR